MRTDILERKDEILKWVAEGLSLTEMKNRLCCKHHTLKSYLIKMGIDYEGQQNRKGQQKGPNKYKDSSYYTYKGAPYITSSLLREKLLKDGIKKPVCESCGNTEWLGQKLPLELHHIDGDHFNNELKNLQILCPNCHAVLTLPTAESHAMYEAKGVDLKEKAEQVATITNLKPLKHHSALDENIWVSRKDLILGSGIDLTKFGWKTELQQATGLTRRQVDLTISHFWEDFCDKIYIRN
jgi:5-methylcytosine-specific restriction endonuclease McrA